MADYQAVDGSAETVEDIQVEKTETVSLIDIVSINDIKSRITNKQDRITALQAEIVALEAELLLVTEAANIATLTAILVK